MLTGAIAALPILATALRAATIVNIDATLYGYAFPTDPAPVPGQVISPFSDAPGGALNQLMLPAGSYKVTNASGLPGANPDFTAWRYNSGPSWVWGMVIADDATDKVVAYTDAGGVQSTQAAIAAEPSVQDVSDGFILGATTTLDFMIRDYGLGDNGGGVALDIHALSLGDVNFDGVVNGLDIADVASHWLSTGAQVAGDANDDGVVNGLDIALIASHWVQTGAGAGATAPEPSAIVLALFGGITLLAYRRRR
jgi:hypothetical protein